MVLLHSKKQPTSHRCESNRSDSKWIPPPDGWVMVNVDAAMFKDPPNAGVGIVIRDHIGGFKAASCNDLAEAMAARCGVAFAKEQNFHQVIVASDCLNIIKKIKSPEKDRSHVGAIVQDIKNLTRRSSFSFTLCSQVL
uniref:RNase H type-1 domain-containing protein n=1 Tax=Arundo donax TaxID=35708 RepID=A0A0A9G2Q1_ARUDO